MKHYLFVLLLSQVGALAQAVAPTPPAPAKFPFDAPGTKTMNSNQEACAGPIGVEHCGSESRSKSFTPATVITYHNDSITMVDTSELLVLHKMLLSTTTSKPNFQQHTHGKEHVLFVANRKQGVDSLDRYKLIPGDTVEVYLGSVNQVIADSAIRNQHIPASMKMVVRASNILRDGGCPHPPGTLLDWWMLTSTVNWSAPTTMGDDDAPTDPTLMLTKYLSVNALYLRRIVIRNGTTIRYFISLNSGCSSLKVCVHTTAPQKDKDKTVACDGEALCRLDRDQMLPASNPFCKANR